MRIRKKSQKIVTILKILLKKIQGRDYHEKNDTTALRWTALVLVLVVRMVRTEPYNASVPFWDLAAHPRGMHPFNPVKLGIGRDPTASSILTPHNSCDLTPPMRGTQQIWNLV